MVKISFPFISFNKLKVVSKAQVPNCFLEKSCVLNEMNREYIGLKEHLCVTILLLLLGTLSEHRPR